MKEKKKLELGKKNMQTKKGGKNFMVRTCDGFEYDSKRAGSFSIKKALKGDSDGKHFCFRF